MTAIGAGIILIVMAFVANRIFGLDIAASSEKIILTFVGILATFIVVTNYAQVSDIKKEMEDKMSQLDRAQQSLIRKVLREQRKERKNIEEEENND